MIATLLATIIILTSCGKGKMYTLPKEFHNGLVRGKSEDLVKSFSELTYVKKYYLAVMAKDSVLYALEVPLVFYNTYQKGDTIK